MESDPKYTVIIRDKTFTLTKSQIEFDGPNYFTKCFLSETPEAESRQLVLFRDPDLFRVVLDYLCGYTVLPISDKLIPPHMTPENALTNLRVDATFYQLNGLVEACDVFSTKQNPTSKENYMAILGTVKPSLEGDAAADLTSDMSSYTKVFISSYQVKEPPFIDLVRPDGPDGPIGFGGLRILAAVQRVVSHMLGPDYRKNWCLGGWNVVRKEIDGEPLSDYEMVILVHRVGVALVPIPVPEVEKSEETMQ